MSDWISQTDYEQILKKMPIPMQLFTGSPDSSKEERTLFILPED